MPVPGRIEGRYKPHEVEEWVKEFWSREGVYEAVKTKSEKQRREFLFIDGPPYTSAPIPHIGTAWNKSIKDSVLRFYRMRGYRVFDRPGYDCHGLPIEVEVEKRMGVGTKKDIESRVGVGKFIEECKQFALSNLRSMTEWFKDLGVFMDWEDPYVTMRDEYIEAGWWLIKKADERGLLDNEFRVVYWCPRCSTTLAEYEIEYKELVDPSIYVKFPVKGSSNEHLLIWTTTPWTLPSNMFVMAHPDATYVKVRVGQEVYILAKPRLSVVMREMGVENYEVIEELKGRDLEGLEYVNPLEKILEIQRRLAKYHRVVLSPEFVSMHEGTGFVHSAPGHGFEDYTVARRVGISEAASPVDDEGRFTEEVSRYAGLEVREANDRIVEDLRKLGALLHYGEIRHRYPICWRCKTPVVLRATRQWVLRVTKLKGELMREASRVEWIPKWALDRLRHILENLQDWVLSRQRYWGTPLPIWICPEGHKHVVGSKEELRRLSGSEVKELHRPWVDEVVFKCPKCGKLMRRVPDVIDVWFDSGIAFYAALGHPEKLGRRDVVADFITEGHDQVRGWFFSLLKSSVIGFRRAPYKRVLVHGFVLDEKGREMHKSLGNYVGTDEAIAKVGRDTLRLGLLQNTVWEDLKFSWRLLSEVLRDLSIAWNVFVFASTYMQLDRFDPETHNLEDYLSDLSFEDLWILSRINRLIKRVTEALESSLIHEAAREVRKFIVEDVSRWYIRLIRPRVWVEEESRDKLAAYVTLYYVLKNWLLLAAPFVPFITERLYQEFIRKSESSVPKSIHLMDWPSPDERFISDEVEKAMNLIKELHEVTAAARMRAGIKLRQPVREVIVYTSSDEVMGVVKRYRGFLKKVLNSREVSVKPVGELSKLITYKVEPVYSRLGPKYRGLTKEIIRYLSERGEEVARDLISKGIHEFVVGGKEVRLGKEDVKVTPIYSKGFSVAEADWGSVAIDTRLSREELADGLARDLIRRIQVMRKELNLPIDERIRVAISCPEDVLELIEMRKNYIAGEVRAEELKVTSEPMRAEELLELTREWEIDDIKVVITVGKCSRT